MNNESFSSLKASILTALSADNPHKTAALINEFLIAFPDRPEPLYFDGLRALLAGDNIKAKERLSLALGFDPGNINVLLNLAVAHQRTGELGLAIAYYCSARQIDPKNLQVLINLGSCYYQAESYQLSKETFYQALKLDEGNAVCLSGLADIDRAKGNWRRAIQFYKKAVAVEPNNELANNNLALMYLNLQNHELAQEAAKKAIEKNPDNIDAHVALGRSLIAREDYEAAMDVFAAAFERNQDHAELISQIGSNFLNVGDHSEASSWFNKALSIEAGHPTAIIGMAQALDKHDLHRQGIELLKEHEETLNRRPHYWSTLSDLYWNEGQADDALECLYEAKKLAPQQASLYSKIGNILSSSGNVEGAEKSFYKALEEQEHCISAISGLATLKKSGLDSHHVATAERLILESSIADGGRASLHNALSYYYAGKKNFEKAAFHMQQSNALQWNSKVRQGWEYDTQKHIENVRHQKRVFSKQQIVSNIQFGHPSRMPVFIVGMPRSGTTLTEQILARHPAVLGVGEKNYAIIALQAYQNLYAKKYGIKPRVANDQCLTEPDGELLTRVAEEYLTTLQEQIDKANKPDVQFVVDKMPDNYLNIGWLKLLFPNACIVHARRDLRDVAMSCWQTQFGMIRWACHIDHLVARFEGYLEIMKHWRDAFSGGFLETDYEHLVEDQEAGSKRLIEYIGLPWDESCLRFYESDRLVRTASITQVRQPIYSTSVAKWAPYEPFIPKLINPLSDLMLSYR